MAHKTAVRTTTLDLESGHCLPPSDAKKISKTSLAMIVAGICFLAGAGIPCVATVAYLARRDAVPQTTMKIDLSTDQSHVQASFFHESALQLVGSAQDPDQGDVGSGMEDTNTKFVIDWNTTFTTSFLKMGAPATPSHRLLQAADQAVTSGSVFELTRDSGPGVLYTKEAEGALSWHIAWQLTEQNVIVHRTTANGLRFTYITDVPAGGLASTSWTNLKKRLCNIELHNFDEYMVPSLPDTTEQLLAQVGADATTRSSMLDVRVLSMTPQTTPDSVYVGCMVVEELPLFTEPELLTATESEEAQAMAPSGDDEHDMLGAWIEGVAASLVDDGSSNDAADDDAAAGGLPNNDADGAFDPTTYTDEQFLEDIGNFTDSELAYLADWEKITPSETKIQLWPRADGAARSHMCATYEFVNPLICDVLAPTSGALSSGRRLSDGDDSGSFTHTLSQSEFTQILLEAANASPWMSTKIYGEDAVEARRHLNDPAYLENVLDALDANRDGVLEALELGGVDAASLALAPASETDATKAVVHGRKQFVFTLIAVAVRVAVHVAVRVATTAATTAVRVAPTVVRAATTAGRAVASSASSGARVVSSAVRTGASRASSVVRSSTSRLRSSFSSSRAKVSNSADDVFCTIGGRRLAANGAASHGRVLCNPPAPRIQLSAPTIRGQAATRIQSAVRGYRGRAEYARRAAHTRHQHYQQVLRTYHRHRRAFDERTLRWDLMRWEDPWRRERGHDLRFWRPDIGRLQNAARAANGKPPLNDF